MPDEHVEEVRQRLKDGRHVSDTSIAALLVKIDDLERNQAGFDAWLRENAYAFAMAMVGAYELAPNGSGVDLSLGAGEDAFKLMLDGERDPAAAVQRALGGKPCDLQHWLLRWQRGESRVEATDKGSW